MLLIITGPTACGKTARAVSAARAFGGEIVSADSRQVYRGMDLGTGKDIGEYGNVPYHVIDVARPGTVYNLFRFLDDSRAAIADIRSRGRLPIVCGGTGMYVEALVNGLELPQVPENAELRTRLKGTPLPELTRMLAAMKTLHNTTDVDTAARAIRAIEIQTYYAEHPEAAAGAVPHPMTDALIVGVDIPRDERRARIARRLEQRLDEGMVDEVRLLLREGIDPDSLIRYGLEYKYLTLHVLGRLTFDEMKEQLLTAIHQFAKRQMTWFRGMERRGHTIHWLPYDMADDEFNAHIRSLMCSCPS